MLSTGLLVRMLLKGVDCLACQAMQTAPPDLAQDSEPCRSEECLLASALL